MSLRVEIASGPHPPRDSTTSGMKVMPTEWQAVAWAVLFRSAATDRACPGVEAAPLRVRLCRVEMTVTSRAAGWPLFQVGR